MNLLLLPGLLCDRAAWAPVLPHVGRVAECSIPDYADETSLGRWPSACWRARRRCSRSPATRWAAASRSKSCAGRPDAWSGWRCSTRAAARARPARAGDAERAGRLALLASARERGMREMARTWVQPMVHPARLADEALIEAILAMFARRTPRQFAGQIEALLARPDATDVLRAVACPALVLCGREDGWAPPSQHEEMAALKPGSRLTILDRCGHMAPMERPDAVGAALVEWLAASRVTEGKDAQCAR